MIRHSNKYHFDYLVKVLQFIPKLIKHIKFVPFTVDTSKLWCRVIIDCVLAFLSIILSTTMRMGIGIFEYSLVALLLNSVVFSLVAGAVFLKLRIDTIVWEKFSISQIKLLLEGVIITNLLSYAMMVLMDRDGCLSSSIMFINVFVLTVLLLIPRLSSRHRTANQALDIIIGSINDVSSGFANAICSNNFNPIGFVISDTDDSTITHNNDYHHNKIPILGKLTEIASILRSLRLRKVTPKRLVIINPIASNELELLKTYTAKNGIILLQVFSIARPDAKLAD